jgi:hypothetical protein
MRSLFLSASVLTLSLFHIACPLDPRYQRTETRILDLKQGGKLQARAFNGSIRVETWDQEKVDLRADIREVEQGNITLHAESREGLVDIWAERASQGSGFPHGAGGISYVLRVPRRIQATFQSSNGSIEVSDISGPVEARTSNGSIKAWNLDKQVTLNTSNASIHVRKVGGDVEAHTSNGSVLAEDIAGDLRGSTSNASLHVEDVKGGIDFTTSNGSIHASDLDGHNKGIRMSTSNASVDVTLGNAKGEVDLRTNRSDNINVQHPTAEILETGSHTRLRIPGANQHIEFNTSNGRITLR